MRSTCFTSYPTFLNFTSGFPLKFATTQITYITLTKQCNALLQHIVDSKRIRLPTSARDPENFHFPKTYHSGPSNSNNLVFVHLMQQILWEDKECEIVKPDTVPVRAPFSCTQCTDSTNARILLGKPEKIKSCKVA
jgi:hypothetical protein